MFFSTFAGKLNAERFISFCRDLLHDDGGIVFLVVDGHPAHRAKLVTEFIKSTDGRLRLFFLPPYSPELNPDKWVWKNVKHDHIGKTVITGAEDLAHKAEMTLLRLKQMPDKIRAFFKDPDLRYITA
jgi:transposase